MRPAFMIAALGALLVVASPASAGDHADGLAPGAAPVILTPPTESGKPLLPPRSAGAAPSDEEACAAPLPCGARLLGTMRKNGAVEFQVPALRW